jgi:cytochrome c553
MNKTLILAVAALGLSAAAQAGDVNAGRKLSDTCVACHGKDGKTPVDPSYPKLAGQYADYLEKALLDYNTGARKNAIMAGIAKPLSKADIKNLAAYYASLPGDFTHRK